MKRLLLTLVLAAATALTGKADSLTTTEAKALYTSTFSGATPTRVSVHDPSVVIGYEATDGKVYPTDATGRKKVYCIFGSHLAWAKSYDMQNWTTFTNNLTTDYATVFATDASYSAHGSKTYDVSGNLWAPDVIYNETMGKWCMYMSVNGDYFYSSIVLLTAESLTGDWTRVGTVVYSLGNKNTYISETDVADYTSSTDRYYWYRNSQSNHTYGTNAIDPCVTYDENGDLWMSYGSWFGGLYLIKLDKTTGLRDKTYTYETSYELADGATAGKMNVNWAVSDEYQGIKIAGGNHCSGEASYIEYHDGRYWLFVTYGGLTAKGGYNMRVFSSEKITGPYTDISGDDARYSITGTNGSTNAGQINKSVGTRLMSYYRWSFMDYGYAAQGHNSAVVDTDGKMYLVYHTRFDDGTEGHQVRVHQLFTFSDGRVMCAPFEYRGETLGTTAFATSDIAGYYGIIRHGNGTDYANLVCAQEEVICLNADGTISGAYTGTWTASTTEPTITIAIKVNKTTETYTGVLLNQAIEETNATTLCFTSVDKYDKSLWGYKRGSEASTFADNVTVATALTTISGAIPKTAFAGTKVTLPSTWKGATLTYESSDKSTITDDGVVSATAKNTTVTMTVTLTCGSTTCTTTASIAVMQSLADVLPLDPNAILAHYAESTDFASQPKVIVSETTGLSLSFLASNITSDWTQIAHTTDGNYSLYLSVLHYGGTDYYEHLATASSAATSAMSKESKGAWELFLNGDYYVTVNYDVNKGTVSYYRDGKLFLTFSDKTSTGNVASGTTEQKPSSIAKAVIEAYNAGTLTFDASVTNVIVGYSANYSPTDLVGTLPIDESNIQSDNFSSVTYADATLATGITETTGLSLSFLVSGVTSDWDVIAKTADDKYHLLLSVLHYDGTDYYEHLGVTTDAATKAISAESLNGPYQLFLNSTHYVTVSYNPDGTIGYYRDGELMLTFNDNCTTGYVASGTTAQKPSDIVKAVIAAYNAGELSFSRSVTSLKIGYAATYTQQPSADAIDCVTDNAIEIHAEGNTIIINGITEGDIATAYDAAGRVMSQSRNGRIEGLARGLYIVRTASVAQRVVVK